MAKTAKKNSAEKPIIQVVDNHIQTAINISNFLEFNGYKTIQAYDSEEAIRLAKKEKPSLIILDLSLDGATGKEVAEKLSNVKVILTVAGVHNEKKGGNIAEIIEKPIDNELLIKLVKKLL